MRKSISLLIIILNLVLPVNSAFSQNVSPADVQKYLKTHPEAKKYISPEGKPTSEGAELLKTHPGAGTLAPAEIEEGLGKLKKKKIESLEEEESKIPKPKISKAFPGRLPVFGEQLFSAGPASFTPPSNMPVSADYIIGPDDNIVVQLWGRINEQYTLTVQRDGSIQFPQIGAIQVAGLTYKQLQDRIKHEAEAITGVNVSVSMGKLRSITVFVVGAVKKPGAYTVSAFDTLLNALIYSGGPDISPPKETHEFPSSSSKEPAVQPEKEKLEKAKEIQKSIDLLKQILQKKKSGEEFRKLEALDIQRLEEKLRKLKKKKIEEGYTLIPNLYYKEQYRYMQDKKEVVQSVLLGSMRNIQLKRRNKTVTTFDLYDLILKGDSSKDMRLEPGDIIFVPKPKAVVAVYGDVKVPAVYELNRDKTLLNALKLAGNIKPSAYSEQIQIQRYLKNRERIVLDISLDELKKEKSPFTLQDGDVVRVFPVVKEDTNAVYLFGNVMRPGKYEYSPGMRITDIIKTTEDLKPETYFPYALIKRYNPPEKSAELVPFKLGEALLKHNMKENVSLQPEDEIHIFNKWTFEDKPSVTITGEVRNPGTCLYEKGMRVKDAMFRTGGLTPDASMGPVNIFRTNPETMEISMLVVDLAGAMARQEDDNILLQDKDSIVVHSIREYEPEKKITIAGEVENPGEYPLAEGMTIRDLVFAAGNLKESAYIYSAELTRYDTSDGRLFKTEVQKINLKNALEGDEADNIKLRKFDTLFIPAIPKWQAKTRVTLSGEVKFPGSYNFTEKGTLSELIERAGGYLPSSYLRGATLTRQSAKIAQRATLDKLIFEMEQELAASSAAAASGALSQEDVAAGKAAMAARRMLLDKLKAADVTGRVIVRLADLDKLKGSKYDIILEDGDELHVPKEPGVVNVMGSVYNPTSLVYLKGDTVKHYLAMVGGPTVNADEDQMFIIRADGMVISKTQGSSRGIRWDGEEHRWFSGGFNSTVLYPGDTVLVPRKLITVSGMKMTKDITEIIYRIAISVGALHYVF
jgi:protein involved in polysaccharide export with SLBB domain